MMDREILDKYVNLDNSCLTKTEKTEVRDLLYTYKDAFSLRNEIELCPNIKIEINVTDKSPFFIRPFHTNEEDKVILDKEIKQLCYLVILKEGFSAYSSPVMLINRKMTKDKRVVMDFRHLNMHIAKNNLAYPLLKDTFLMLGSSRCKVMLVLDLKDAFHSLKTDRKFKEVLWHTSLFWKPFLLVPKDAYGIEYLPSYLAVLYKCNIKLLASRKYCEAIMDDLLVFTPINHLISKSLKICWKLCVRMD